MKGNTSDGSPMSRTHPTAKATPGGAGLFQCLDHVAFSGCSSLQNVSDPTNISLFIYIDFCLLICLLLNLMVCLKLELSLPVLSERQRNVER